MFKLNIYLFEELLTVVELYNCLRAWNEQIIDFNYFRMTEFYLIYCALICSVCESNYSSDLNCIYAEFYQFNLLLHLELYLNSNCDFEKLS